MLYSEDFVKRVKAVIENLQLSKNIFPEIYLYRRKALKALDTQQGMLGMYLEQFSIFWLSLEKKKQLLAEGKQGELLQYDRIAIACAELLKEWDRLYYDQKIRVRAY